MNRLRYVLLALLAACSVALAQSNVLGTLLASAARTTTTNSADVTNTSTRGAHIVVTVTAYVSGIWTPIVQGKDPVSGNYYNIATGPTITGTGTYIMKVYPGLMSQTEADVLNGQVFNDFLPRTWRLQMLGASTPSATFSAGYLGEF